MIHMILCFKNKKIGCYLRSSEGTLISVCVYEPETIKLNTDHYFIEQYNRQRAPQKKISRCLLASWNLDQNLGRIRNRRRHCSWTDTFFFSLILITIKNNSQFFLFLYYYMEQGEVWVLERFYLLFSFLFWLKTYYI